MRSSAADKLIATLAFAFCGMIVSVSLWPSPRLEWILKLVATGSFIAIAIRLQCDWLLAGDAHRLLVWAFAIFHVAAGIYSSVGPHLFGQPQPTGFVAGYGVVWAFLTVFAWRQKSAGSAIRKAISIPIPALFVYLAMQEDVLRSSWLYWAVGTAAITLVAHRALAVFRRD